MTRILLVDDEPLVLVGLQTMLPWSEYSMEICGTARSGAQAIEIIEQKRPDIVITDIMMPVRGGLELMETCREKYGRLPLFIILTCVEEFTHVKQAMRSQAVDYLIKLELTAEILAQSIQKALDILQSLGKKPDSLGMQAFHDRLFLDLFNNRIESPQELEIKRKELGIDFSFDSYVVCCCELDTTGTSEQQMNLHTSTTRMTWETVNKFIPCHITSLGLQQFVITFCLTKENGDNYQHSLTNILTQTIEIIKKYFNVELSCCLGVKVASPLLLSDSYHTARLSLTAVNRVRPIHFYNVKSNADNIVNDVKEYIRQNLDKRLGLNQVAEIFGFTPKYISGLFAKHAECSFVEYVTAAKINLARELLLVSDTKVYEVSEKLGFESSFYFSKVFKKHTGLSPRAYVRRHM